MEPTVWARFIGFVKESYLYRFKESFAGIFMGFGISKHILFAGQLANLVGAWWWVFKSVGSLIMAFLTSLLTSYAAVLVKRWTDPEKKSRRSEKRKNKRAA